MPNDDQSQATLIRAEEAWTTAAVPLVYGAGVALGSNIRLEPGHFFFSLVFPYLVVVLMAYVGSRVVYGLGTAVRKAREMGSYRLVRRLGEGGMGEVWRAQHRMLARPAAIKLIRPEVLGGTEVQSKQLLRRFEREAQATALMRSPHAPRWRKPTRRGSSTATSNRPICTLVATAATWTSSRCWTSVW